MTPTYSFTFDKVYVIESLPDGERLTGKELYEDIIQRKIEQKGFEIHHQLFTVDTSADFFETLKFINEDVTENGFHPIIHFEIHGDEDGLGLKSGDLVKWGELTDILRKINLGSNNNTFLSLATCYGIYIFKSIKPFLTSPFWGTVSSPDGILPSKALAGFQSFYETLLEDGDFNAAVVSLNKEYDESKTTFFLRNTQYVFQKAIENLESRNFTDELINIMVEEGLLNFRKNNPIYSELYSDDYIKYIIRTVHSTPTLKNLMIRVCIDNFTNNGKFSN